MKKYNYYSGTQSSDYRDQVEIKTRSDTCIVDIPSYINGRVVFPCASGDDRTLTSEDKAAINREIAVLSGINNATPVKIRKYRVELEKLLKANLNNFYDWKDCLDWACSELEINSNSALKFMYPTPQEYLAIAEFRNLK